MLQKNVHNQCRVVGSRSHRGSSLDAFLDKLGGYEMLPMGSSLKFCKVAEGAADIYPRLGPTSEWDTAAAQAVVEQAGGRVIKLDGKSLSYNEKEDILNPYFLVLGAARSRLARAVRRRGIACCGNYASIASTGTNNESRFIELNDGQRRQ